jgi:hypothetical protein
VGSVVRTTVALSNPVPRSSNLIGSIIGTGCGLRNPTDVRSGTRTGPTSSFWSPKTDAKAIFGMLTSSWINVLLVIAPLGYVADKLEWGAVSVFCLVRSDCPLAPVLQQFVWPHYGRLPSAAA